MHRKKNFDSYKNLESKRVKSSITGFTVKFSNSLKRVQQKISTCNERN